MFYFTCDRSFRLHEEVVQLATAAVVRAHVRTRCNLFDELLNTLQEPATKKRIYSIYRSPPHLLEFL